MKLIVYFHSKSISAGAIIVQAGEYTDSFFLFTKGTFVLIENESGIIKKSRIIQYGSTNLYFTRNKGRCSGQLAPNSVICEHSGEYLYINSVTYQRTLLEISMSKQNKNKNFIGKSPYYLDNIPILAPLTNEQRLAVANELKPIVSIQLE